VISMRLFAGRTLIHVLSDEKPEEGFDTVAPDLEDLYFATIKGFVHGSVSAGGAN
jgi:ABC-2 type transport system ATP-binding protein